MDHLVSSLLQGCASIFHPGTDVAGDLPANKVLPVSRCRYGATAIVRVGASTDQRSVTHPSPAFACHSPCRGTSGEIPLPIKHYHPDSAKLAIYGFSHASRFVTLKSVTPSRCREITIVYTLQPLLPGKGISALTGE